jgi:hypothetical protein
VSSADSFFQCVGNSSRFREAIRQFDALNAQDPSGEFLNGTTRPRELLYAERLSDWVMKLAPEASEVLRLASRCQHLCRWMIPRSNYEMDRAGYHQWRNELKRFHAAKSAEVLRKTGYNEDIMSRVAALNLKKNFPTDPESRVLEDALCLVFLQFQLPDLASKTEDEKVINALQKSWKKMTPLAREHALKLDHAPGVRVLINRALGLNTNQN